MDGLGEQMARVVLCGKVSLTGLKEGVARGALRGRGSFRTPVALSWRGPEGLTQTEGEHRRHLHILQK